VIAGISTEDRPMKIVITSVLVDDQDKALAFYRDVLGFVLRHDIPMGGPARWLTLTSPADASGAGDDCRVRRHLRQSHTDQPAALRPGRR
jgi:catechol 2,3-dioxygenase-like lactoylglutathione lyase family enzyme